MRMRVSRRDADKRHGSAAVRRLVSAAMGCVLTCVLSACGYGSEAPKSTQEVAPKGPRVDGLDSVRVGYFGNVTHATPLVDRQKGFIQRALGGTQVKPYVFNAGNSEIEALNAGTIDIGWIGPSPAINGYVRSHGRNLRIIGGASSGGASFVVNREKIRSVKGLKGKRIATPQRGNTQDVALLDYLGRKGFTVDPATGRGDVSVLRLDNKEILNAFRQGRIDGAWVPQPVASELVAEGGRKLVDEKRLWRNGQFVITNIIASQRFLQQHPKAVEAVLRGSLRTNAWIRNHPTGAAEAINASLRNPKVAGAPLPGKVLRSALGDIDVTDDPLAPTLKEEAKHAERIGLLKKPDLRGIYDLRLLDKLLKTEGKPQVGAAGLDAR